MKNFARLTLLLLPISLMVGCIELADLYKGYPVPEEAVVPLSAKQTETKWPTFDLTITYKYEQNDTLFDISGTIELSEHYQMNYVKLDKLNVYFVFVDSESKALYAESILNSVSSQLNETFVFEQQITVPPGATGYTFFYDLAATQDN